MKFVIREQNHGFGISKSPKKHMRDEIKNVEMITFSGAVAIILSGICKNLFVNFVN